MWNIIFMEWGYYNIYGVELPEYLLEGGKISIYILFLCILYVTGICPKPDEKLRIWGRLLHEH